MLASTHLRERFIGTINMSLELYPCLIKINNYRVTQNKIIEKKKKKKKGKKCTKWQGPGHVHLWFDFRNIPAIQKFENVSNSDGNIQFTI